MKSRRVVLSLGSNLGDRLGYLQGAVGKLCESGEKVIAVSPIYETAPWGPVEQDDYLNCVIVLETTRSAREIMNLGHEIEQFYQRTRDVKWGSRTLDIDVVAVEEERVNDPDLVIPHPYAHQRAFVVVPWLDIDPNAEIFGQGSLTQIVKELDVSSVCLRSDLIVKSP
ncbi:MAG: 2-amino-4-hydroxy-6-hydroxymethyldihydropteridine diphosphokinase [Propionibacteriaceae bacterium]